MNRVKAFRTGLVILTLIAISSAVSIHLTTGATPPPEKAHTYRQLPAPKISVPTPPYSDSVPHPVDSASLSQSVVDKATADFLSKRPKLAPFTVDSVWRIDSKIQVGTGHFANQVPAAFSVQADGSTKLVTFASNGAPGPAYIKGVKGDLVLIAQGFGYQVFNYKTYEISQSDESANPGRPTVLGTGSSSGN